MQNNQSVREFVIGFLKKKIPANYYYHNYEHTLYVTDRAIETGIYENCSEEEIDLLQLAALWHDTGFTVVYTGHEEQSCALARQYLPDFGYSTPVIKKVCGMIMATRIPQSPQNKLEEIIADADLEYLGTKDAAVKAGSLFKELQYLDTSLTTEQWLQQQIAFLQMHRYFTAFCKENRDPGKQAYLQWLMTEAADQE